MTDRRLVPVALAALVMALFLPFLVSGKVFVPGDFLDFVYPWKAVYHRHVQNIELFDVTDLFYPEDNFLNTQLKQGRLPLWNPNLFAGYPVFASGQSAYFYAPKLLLQWLLPTGEARTMLQLLQMLAMGAAMYFWLKGRRLSPGASGVGAAVWMMNAYVASWMEYAHVLVIGTWLPVMLLAADRALETRRWRWWGLMAVGGALCLLGGHLQYSLYAGPLAGLYALVRAYRLGRFRRGVAGVAIGALGGVGLAAPMLIPFLEFQRMGQRYDLSFATLRHLSAPWWSFLPTLVCPDVWGNPVSGFSFNRNIANLIFPEFACYIGFLPLLLAVVAVVSRRRESLAWFAVAVISLAFAAATPLYYPVVLLLPFLAKLIPLRILFIFTFAGAVLAAMGAQRVLDDEAARRLLGKLAIGLSLVWALAFGAIAWLVTAGRPVLGGLLKPYLSPAYILLPPSDLWLHSTGYLLKAMRTAYLGDPQMYWPLICGPVVAWLALRARRLPAIALVLVTGLDLLLFAARFNPTIAPGDLYPPTPGIRYLQSRRGLFRVEPMRVAFDDTLNPYGIEVLTGYESIFPNRYMALLSLVDPGVRQATRSAALHKVNSPIVDALNVRYVLTLPFDRLKGKRWKQVYAGSDMRIYENRQVLPRAYVVGHARVFEGPGRAMAWLASKRFDPATSVALEARLPGPVDPAASGSPVDMDLYQPDRVVMTVHMRAPGVLVLADEWHPGWKARVDGTPVPVYLADLALRGIYLPAGTHLVEFTFDPPSLHLGLLLAGLTGLLLAALVLGDWFHGKASPKIVLTDAAAPPATK